MPNNSIVQNLVDAGCDKSLIENFIKTGQEGMTKKQLELLSGQRRILLDNVHENQKRLDCLDYLIFNIKTNKIRK